MPGFATILDHTISRRVTESAEGRVAKTVIIVRVQFRIAALTEIHRVTYEVDDGVPLDAEVRRLVLALIGRTVRQWALRKLEEAQAPPALTAPFPVPEQDADTLAALEP